MLLYDRSEGTQVKKFILLKVIPVNNVQLELFFNHGFEFQDSVWNGYHDLIILCLNTSNITIITVKGVNYRSRMIVGTYKIDAKEINIGN